MSDLTRILDALEFARSFFEARAQMATPGSEGAGKLYECAKGCADAMAMLKAQEARKRLEVHNVGNVDIPDGVTWEQFQAVMDGVVKALEHTDNGESWPYTEQEANNEVVYRDHG